MKSSKVIHHPGRDGEQFSTVEDQIEQHTADIAALDSEKVAKAGDTMTGTLTVPYLTVQAQGGPEGGEIQLAKPTTGSSLAGNIIIDVTQNNWRIFEGGGSARGVRVDLTGAAAGAGSLLIHSTTLITSTISGCVEYPENKRYIPAFSIPFGGTITNVACRTSAGSCDVSFEINGGAIGALTANTTGNSAAVSNGFSAGDSIGFTVSSVSNAEMLQIRMTYTRTLA